jgi:hypothetical protein
MRDWARLIIVCVAIVVVGYANWLLAKFSPDITPIEAVAENFEVAVSAQTDDVILRSVNLVQAQTRPLFETSRRPWVPPARHIATPVPDLAVIQTETPIPQQATAPEPLEAKLVGIQRSKVATMVLISDWSGAAPEWFKTGSSYKGWVIGHATADSVILEKAGTTLELELYPPLPSGLVAP